MARDSLRAAKSLKDRRNYRSSVSRSYYAAFSLATSQLARLGVGFYRYEHPLHNRVRKLVKQHLTALGKPNNADLCSVLNGLYKARLDADYVSGVTIDEPVARNMIRDACRAFRILGVEP